MLQPGSEELKRDEINIPPPEQSCNALHGSGFSAARLYTPAHKDAFKYKWMHSCVRATATRRDNDEIPRLIERSPVNRVSTHVGDGWNSTITGAISMKLYACFTNASGDTIQRWLLNFTLYINLWSLVYKGTKGYWIRRTASLNCLAPLGELGVASRLGIRECGSVHCLMEIVEFCRNSIFCSM